LDSFPPPPPPPPPFLPPDAPGIFDVSIELMGL